MQIYVNGGSRKSVLPVPHEVENVTFASYNVFAGISNDTVLYLPAVEPRIYKCYGGQAEVLCELDFHGLWPDFSDVKKDNPLDLMRSIAEDGKIYSTNMLSEGNDVVVSFFCKDMANITLEGEYYEDTEDAIKLLGSRLPSHKIFIVAHSQGATLVPDLLKRNPSVVGAVAMAGSPRNLFELIFDQQMHQLDVQEELSENDREKKIAEATNIVKKMRAISSPDDQVPPPFSGMLNAAYAADLNRLDPIETAKGLTVPMLFLQGESDQQVYLDPDFRAWQEALSGQEGVEFKSFPKLNHFFWETQGLPPLEDIAAPNKVSPEVITEISRWLTQAA